MSTKIQSDDDKRLDIFGLLWLDANSNEDRDTEQSLRSIINHLKKFQHIKQCQQYIEQTTDKGRLVLIVNGRMGREIVPKIHTLRQIISIYVYCMDKRGNEEWALQYKKVKAVVVELDELIVRIKADHKIQKKVEEPLSINTYTAGKSTSGVNGQFVFSQVLLDCLLRLKSTSTDKDELIHYCQEEYRGNLSELENIREFAEEYSSDKALWWYTRETFFYKILNATLRKNDIHMIFLFRGFIYDIYRQLQNEQSNKRLRVYRGQIISRDELKNLKTTLGQYISINSFFSTSTDYANALVFVKVSNTSNDLERVLFEIDADPKLVTTKPFADISKYSDYDEAEVLFMLGTIFRLETINRNDDDEVWIIRMTLCSDDEHELKKVLMHMKQQTGSGETNLRTLGKIVWKMGKLDLAEKYLTRLLNELSPNDPLLSVLYEDLSELASLRGNYDTSIEWQQKALVFKEENPLTVSSNTHETNQFAEVEFISRITKNTQWKQHGITVVGGNGDGDQLNQLSNPFSLFVDNDTQMIYIADYNNHRIVEWKLNIKNSILEWIWPSNKSQVIAGGNGKGNQMNQLDRPTDVIVDTKNNSLIICDMGNRRVVEWSREYGTKNGQILISHIDCYSLKMDKDGYIYISDWKKDEVRRWKRGETNVTIVAGGNGEGDCLNQLSYPTYLFVDHADSIYVSDYHNHRVMKWAKDAREGIIVAGGQGEGDELTQLYHPNGITVDSLDNIYVADGGNHRIVCWSRGSNQGRIIVGGNGGGAQSNQLNSPEGLSFDQEDNLYVVDWDNHRVQKFEIHRYE